MWFDQLTSLDKRVLVFIHCYENIRRKQCQFGYKVFRVQDVSIIDKPVFKQGRTVVSWLDKQGWTISWNTKHWLGYVKFVFKELNPTVPQIGQLKNQVLLKHYILSSPNLFQKHVPIDTLEKLYQGVVRSDITKHASLMFLFGLRGIKLCE